MTCDANNTDLPEQHGQEFLGILFLRLRTDAVTLAGVARTVSCLLLVVSLAACSVQTESRPPVIPGAGCSIATARRRSL